MSFRRTPRPLTYLLAAWALALVAASACGPAIPSKPTWDDVEPIFEAHCNRCHGEGRPYAVSVYAITSDQSLWVVQIGIVSFKQQYSSAQNYIMAASTVVAMPTMLLFFIFQRQLVESIKTSGLK